VNTDVALAPASKSTVARRVAAAHPSVILEATREAMARSRATVVVRRNPAMAVNNHPGTNVKNTAVKLEATAVSSRSMVLTHTVLADTAVKRSPDMAAARKSRVTAAKSMAARNHLVTVLTLTAPVDTVVQKVRNTVVNDPIRLMAPLVSLEALAKSLKATVVAVMTKMNMALAAMVALEDTVKRGMEDGTRYDVFFAGSEVALSVALWAWSTKMTVLQYLHEQPKPVSISYADSRMSF
jgi:hypothetical protein